MTTLPDLTVHIVDDDPDVLQSLTFMLGGDGIRTTTHETAEGFLKALPQLEPGCVLLDLKLGRDDGLEVQRRLLDSGHAMPVVVMTGHGSVPSAVTAMKLGAIDFIQKPFGKADLMAALDLAREQLEKRDEGSLDEAAARRLLDTLSPRERQVVDGLVHGQPNKNIAYDLGISPRTVEIHRANAMRKLEAKTLPEMLHIAFQAGIMAK